MPNKLLFCLAFFCVAGLLFPPQVRSQTNYSNKASKQKLVTQLKAVIEATASNYASYKGKAMKDSGTLWEHSEMKLFKSSKPFTLSKVAAVAVPQEGTGNEFYLEFEGFASDEAAVEFGESLITSLKALSYSFGKLVGAASGSDSVLELDINKGKKVPKSLQGLKILINVPPGDYDTLDKKIFVRIIRASW